MPGHTDAFKYCFIQLLSARLSSFGQTFGIWMSISAILGLFVTQAGEPIVAQIGVILLVEYQNMNFGLVVIGLLAVVVSRCS